MLRWKPAVGLSAVVPRAVALCAFAAAALLCSGCAGGSGAGMSVASYNVQNLFDAEVDGSEYPRYDPRSREWDTELYHVKLRNLSRALRDAGGPGMTPPDILVLQEVENLRALSALRHRIGKRRYPYGALTAVPGSAVQVALLSRYRVTEVRAHALAHRGFDGLRDILEVRLRVPPGEPLVVYVNHWKSKHGGAQATAPARELAARALSRLAGAATRRKPAPFMVAAGDFNTELASGIAPGSGPTSTRSGGATRVLRSGWTLSEASEEHAANEAHGPRGSYVYGGSWKRIDDILIGPRGFDGRGLEFQAFRVVRPAYLLNREGAPRRFAAYRVSGYSDHLPIVAEFRPAQKR